MSVEALSVTGPWNSERVGDFFSQRHTAQRESREGESFYHSLSIMTAGPQIWYFLEGGYDVYRLVPSRGWSIFFNLQKMQQSSLYADQELLVSVFYEDGELYQVAEGGGG